MGDLAQEYWQKQTVLVTGGTGGLGQEMVRHFAALGCRVAINYFSRDDRAQALLGEINSAQVKIYRADIRKENEVERMVEEIAKALGPVSILINNAGYISNHLLVMNSLEDWQKIIDTHLTGTFLVSRGVVKNMMKVKFGRIINISSVSAIEGGQGQTSYAAAKAGIIGFAKALSHELGPLGITCNTLVLSMFDTESAKQGASEELARRRLIQSPFRRVGKPKEILDALEYLASDKSNFVTGQTLQLG